MQNFVDPDDSENDTAFSSPEALQNEAQDMPVTTPDVLPHVEIGIANAIYVDISNHSEDHMANSLTSASTELTVSCNLLHSEL